MIVTLITEKWDLKILKNSYGSEEVDKENPLQLVVIRGYQ